MEIWEKIAQLAVHALKYNIRYNKWKIAGRKMKDSGLKGNFRLKGGGI